MTLKLETSIFPSKLKQMHVLRIVELKALGILQQIRLDVRLVIM